jgi:hypothetical protein
MTYYVKTHSSKQDGMIDKRDNGTVLYYRGSDVISYDTEPQSGYTEDATLNPGELTLIKEEPDWVKIHRFILVSNYSKDVAPIDHNYKSGLVTTLFPKREFFHGELQRVCWFADKSFTDLIIEVNIVYTRDPLGFPIERVTTRTWFCEDGTPAPLTKITEKEYAHDPILQLKEGIIRRGNLVTNLTASVMGMMMATIPANAGESELERQGRVVVTGRNFLALYKQEFNNFIDDSNKEVITAITNAQDAWLAYPNPYSPTTTIKDYILFELNSI